MKTHASKHWFYMLYLLIEKRHLYFKLFLILVESNGDTDHRQHASICLALIVKTLKIYDTGHVQSEKLVFKENHKFNLTFEPGISLDFSLVNAETF